MLSNKMSFVFLTLMLAFSFTACKGEETTASDASTSKEIAAEVPQQKVISSETDSPTPSGSETESVANTLLLSGEVHDLTAKGFQLNRAEMDEEIRINGDTGNYMNVQFAETVTYEIKTFTEERMDAYLSAATNEALIEGATVDLEGSWSGDTFIANKIMVWESN